MTLAEKLKKLRKQNKMSMSQVARVSELSTDQRGRITQGYISRLESGKETNPSLQKLLTLCSIYNIDPNELFSGSGPKKAPKHPFSTKIQRSATQETEAGIRRIAEELAKSPRYLAPIRDLMHSVKGRRLLALISKLPEKQQSRAFDHLFECIKSLDLNNQTEKIPQIPPTP